MCIYHLMSSARSQNSCDWRARSRLSPSLLTSRSVFRVFLASEKKKNSEHDLLASLSSEWWHTAKGIFHGQPSFFKRIWRLACKNWITFNLWNLHVQRFSFSELYYVLNPRYESHAGVRNTSICVSSESRSLTSMRGALMACIRPKEFEILLFWGIGSHLKYLPRLYLRMSTIYWIRFESDAGVRN